MRAIDRTSTLLKAQFSDWCDHIHVETKVVSLALAATSI